MSKDAKDSKLRPEGLRQPQRKDSLSSILSWAALQSKITAPKTPATTSSTSQPPQTSPGSLTSRRHSHGSRADTSTKARRGSTTSRRLSLSSLPAIQDGAGAKTRHSKTSATADPKPSSPGASRTGKNSSSEKVNKATSDSPDAKTTARTRPGEESLEKPSSPAPPKPKPKSILRSPVPDPNIKRPEKHSTSDTNPPTTTTPDSSDAPPPTLAPVGLPPDSPPSSPPMSPLHRPMSPGTTVRFAKATIHRVELGPGPRRFLPVKRKSKSTLTYLAPLDPATQNINNNHSSSKNQKGKNALLLSKTVLQNPIKLRRHQENQAAMGRYWLRTEEEEAQWRAEAEQRAREEAERYRNEPASPPLLCSSPISVTGAVEKGGGGEAGVGREGAMVGKGAVVEKGVVVEEVAVVEKAAVVEKVAVAEKKAAIVEKHAVAEKVSSLGSGVMVVEVEEVMVDEDVPKADEEAGVNWDRGLDETPSVTVKDSTELKASANRSGPKSAEVRGVKEAENPHLTAKTPVEEPLEVKAVTSPKKAKGEPPSSIPVTAIEQAKVESPNVTPVATAMQQAKSEPPASSLEAVTVAAISSPEPEDREALPTTPKITKPDTAEVQPPTSEIVKVEGSKVCPEKPAEEQVAAQKAETVSNTSDQPDAALTETEPDRDKTPESSPISTVEEKQKTEEATGQKRRDSTGSADCPSPNSIPEPTERLTKVPSGDKAKETERDREKTREKEKAREKAKTAPVSRPVMPARSGGTGKADRAASRGSNSTTSSHSHGHGHGSNHLHLSGRRGRRYSDHKEGITA